MVVAPSVDVVVIEVVAGGVFILKTSFSINVVAGFRISDLESFKTVFEFRVGKLVNILGADCSIKAPLPAVGYLKNQL